MASVDRQSGPRVRRWSLVGATVLVVALLATTARAQEPGPSQDKKAQARAKLVEGDRLLKLGEFQQALAAFKDAYDLYPSPKIRYNFGLAYEGMGRNADALEAFDAFLVQATDASPETRDRAVATRNTLLGRVGTLRVVADVEGAEIIVDGRDMGKTAPARELRLDPGPHLLLVDRGGGTPPFTQRLDVAAGAAVTVVVRLTPPAAQASTTPPAGAGAAPPEATTVARAAPAAIESPASDRGRPWRMAGIATAAAGAGFLGGGLLFGLAARSASTDVSHQFDASQDSAGKRDETLQWIGYGVGAAAIATGAWLYFHARAVDRALDASDAPALQVGLLPGRLLLQGRF